MRWKKMVLGLALAVSLATGCKQQCFLNECDYHHYHELSADIPRDLDTNPTVANLAGPYALTPKPSTVRDPERRQRFISLAEAIAIALEQSSTAGGQGGGSGRVSDQLLSALGARLNDSNVDAIRVLALSPAIVGTEIEAALSKFDVQWNTQMTWSFQDQPVGNPSVAVQALGGANALQGISTNRATFNTGLIKPLPTGGVAGITFNTVYTDTNSPIQRVNPSYAPSLQFQFEQPLLQGFGVEINQLRNSHPGSLLNPFRGVTRQEGILLTRLRYDQSRAEFERNVQLLVWNVEVAYWNLYGAYWNLYSQEQAMRQAYEAWKINKARYDAGRVSIAELAQTLGQYELFRGNRLDALGQGDATGGRQGGVLEAERNLRAFLGLPMEDGTRLVPSDTPTLAPYQPDWNTALQEALTLKPELVLARQELKARQLDLIQRKNQLLPDLRFLSTYEITSLGGSLEGPGNDNALRNLASNRFNNWSLGLQMNVPLGFREAHADLRVARLNLARSYFVLRDSEYRATRALTQEYRLLVERYDLIQTRRSQREAFAQQLRARFQEFLAGRGTLDVLLEAQRFWANALSSEYAAIVEYNNALAGFEWAKGTILHHDNVFIAEGALPGCAQVRAVDHERERTKALVLLERALPVPHGCGPDGAPLPELPKDTAPSLPSLMEGAPPVPEKPELAPSPRRTEPGQPQAAGPQTLPRGLAPQAAPADGQPATPPVQYGEGPTFPVPPVEEIPARRP